MKKIEAYLLSTGEIEVDKDKAIRKERELASKEAIFQLLKVAVRDIDVEKVGRINALDSPAINVARVITETIYRESEVFKITLPKLLDELERIDEYE